MTQTAFMRDHAQLLADPNLNDTECNFGLLIAARGCALTYG